MKTLLLLFLSSLILLTGTVSAHAAVIAVDAPQAISKGTQALIYVSLGTEGETINAIEGTISVPESLKVVDVRFSGSVVPLWVESPHLTAPQTLTFAGVLPGGYANGARENQTKGNLFTLVVEGLANGSSRITISSDTQVYANDGAGSAITLTYVGANIVVSDTGTDAEAPLPDTDAPTSLDIEVVSGALVGTTGDTLVFIAQDKDSAIGTYGVARSLLPFAIPFMTYRTVSSPLPLTFFDRISFIHIRATDTAGNHLTKTIVPYGVFAHLPLIIVVILILALARPLRRSLYAIIKKR